MMSGSFFSFPAFNLEKLWEVWSTRILVALVIMAVFDYWQRKDRHQQQQQQQQHLRQRSNPYVAPVLSYEPMDAETTPTPTTRKKNPLLDQLDHQRKTIKQEQSQQEDHPSVNDDDDSDGNKNSKNSELSSKPKPTSQTARTAAPSSTTANTTARTTTHNPPPISAKTNHHPGMQGFGHWYETETSLYRIYTLGRHDGVQVVPPYVPHSYRGKVPINLHVTNQTNSVLSVYWVDFKGKHVLKGTMKPNHVWTQQTWIDHPWVFEGPDINDNPTPYLYYVPYRVIPTLPECPTVYPDDPQTGLHKFAIIPPANNKDNNSPFHVGVRDDVLPFPAVVHFTTPVQGITWTLQHMSRLNFSWNDPAIDLLQKYLTNIVESPETTKYRQLRIGGGRSKFGSAIWNYNSPLQGLLLSVGFVEHQGYAELGCSDKPLSRDRIQDLALLSYLIAQWQRKEQQQISNLTAAVEQPEGADGFGRAGFGRVGGMNY